MFYFQPTGQAYSKEQIQGFVGIDPEVTDDEILNFYNVFRVVPWDGERDPFLALGSQYEIRDSFAYQLPSTEPIPLEEAKEKAKQIVIQGANRSIRFLAENSQFSPELFHVAVSVGSSYFDSLRGNLREILEKLESKLRAIDSATDDTKLREICFGG